MREIDCQKLPGARRSSCLLFEADHIARRVYQYPANWRELPDPELEQLSWRT